MKRVYISKVLSADLKSRATVHNLYAYLEQSDIRHTIIDFSNVNFAARSFVDEFYNVFIKDLHIRVENIPDDIQTILSTVERTQTKDKPIPSPENVKTFSSVDEFCSFFATLSF